MHALKRIAMPLVVLALALTAPAGAMDPEAPTEPVLLPGSALAQGGLVRGQVAPGTRVWRGERELQVDARGRFVTGLHRDDPAELVLRLRLPDGSEQRSTFGVRQRAYDEQRIDGLPGGMVTPPEDVLARIRAEQERVNAARSHETAMDAVFESFVWPVTGTITSVYGSRRILNGEPRQPHYGIDIAASRGTPIRATAAGIVRMADADLYYTGGTVIIDHGHGVSSTYLHMASLDVAVGDEVARGARIGTVGATGRVTGPHLCFRYNWFDKRLDPALLLPEAQPDDGP
ncbi:M23 family metallopeptidase [Algiphilus sp.]|uniref:M23 family metallopeptidase n=1 Tax=Algiphilus sp. TaxID=1872431 RepID=UPI0025BEA2E2|nr:M23 family metallopeptidase [Algiphilus sp.]MCK5771658.1 M23 family metallopeptidase [Algiphilus sp.]